MSAPPTERPLLRLDTRTRRRIRADRGHVKRARRYTDVRSVHVPVPPERAFRPIERIGGETGWYFANALWRARGLLDLLVGGVGLRRAQRREPLAAGEALDFWRVEALERGRLLRLRAEMRLPGSGWLQFEVEPEGSGARIRQTAIFDSVGYAGAAYWYALYPVHAWIFAGLLRELARLCASQRADGAG